MYPVANQPIANQPATAYTILYNTNYNTVYPIANRPEATRPATAWTINYNSNYNVVYPIATQPEAARPSTAWTVNYNTNYNVAYPIANQPEAARPVTAYTPGNAGTPTTVLGVYLPGGPVDLSGFAGNPGTAPTVSPTVVSYYDYPDNSNYPVTVPPGGQVNVTLE